jgi:glycerol-3-phosphate dehydrogenase
MRERRALLTIAPGLVRPLEFLVPAYGNGLRGAVALGLGVALADLLTPDRNRGVPTDAAIGSSRRLSPGDVLARVPGLSAQGLTGGVTWTDAQVTSSERLVLAFLHSAAHEGAVLANHVEVTGLSRVGGRVRGAEALDHHGRSRFGIRARFVVNAAGARLDPVLARSGIARLGVPQLSGLNLVLGRPLPVPMAVGGRADGRFLFVVPWNGRTLVGTDYAPPAQAGRPQAFLHTARRAFPWAGLSSDQVELVHRGLVPGRDGRALWSRHRLVDHAVTDGTFGLLSVVSVKLTTARGVAEAVVDRVLARLERRGAACRTAHTPLRQGGPETGDAEARASYAVRHEMALHLDDLVLRRLDLGTTGPPPSQALELALGVLASARGLTAEAVCAERSRLGEALLLTSPGNLASDPG